MFTRAYDAIMCGMFVQGRYTNAFDTTQLSDTILNAKDYSGAIRSLSLGGSASDYGGHTKKAGAMPPFSYFSNTISTDSEGNTALFPDTDSTTHSYEDYSIGTSTAPSGWQALTLSSGSSEYFDSETNEYVCTSKIAWSNTSTSEKTVYGIAVRYKSYYKINNSSNVQLDTFLIAREHFAQPVTVPVGGSIKLSLTYRVGRHGVRIDSANGGV